MSSQKGSMPDDMEEFHAEDIWATIYLGFTKVVYGMLYLLVYHQYSLVNEIGPPHKQDAFAWWH